MKNSKDQPILDSFRVIFAKNIMRYFIYWLALSIICVTAWVYSIFGAPLIEQIIMQIAFADLQKPAFPIILIKLFIKNCIIYPIIFTVVIFIIEVLIKTFFKNILIPSLIAKRPPNPSSPASREAARPGISAVFTRSPISTAFGASVGDDVGNGIIFSSKLGVWFKKIFLDNAHICLLLLSLVYLESTFSVRYYIKSQFEKKLSYIDYVNPESIRLTPKNNKNLVLIYAESIENAFNDSTLFKENILKDFDSLPGINFSAFNQVSGTGWTIAGIFASQCAEYIYLDFLEEKHFCLSDILAREGYHNVYMQGASLDFTYTGKFLRKHQYHELYGREEWQQKGFNEFNDWGLYDDDLFEQAKIKLKELHANHQPFNLTILTVDTHAPTGYTSKSCHKANCYDDIIECSVKEIVNFIKFIENNDFLKDTNVVIIGDHLYPADHKLPVGIKKVKRTIFNQFIANNYPTKIRENINHFDLLPTILKFIGFDIPGDKLGLGKSAFN